MKNATQSIIVKLPSRYVLDHGILFAENLDEHLANNPERLFGNSWTTLAKLLPGISIQRAVTSITPQQQVELVKAVKQKPPTPGRHRPNPDDLLSYFIVRPPQGTSPQVLLERLRAWKEIEFSYIEGRVSLPTRERPGNTREDKAPPQSLLLGPAPDGIDAQYAWTINGGSGGADKNNLDLRFADVEQGWQLPHPDLPSDHIQSAYGNWGGGNTDHGNLALGVVLAVPNDLMCVGIAPNVTSTMVASSYPGNATSDVANAIAATILADDSKLRSGDVLLVEVEMRDENDQRVPIEIDSLVFQWIWNATARNIVVVEAAGNGGLDLDTYTRFQVPLLARGNPQYKESLAIMVGAAYSSTPASAGAKPRSPMYAQEIRLHNYGSRLDCYAWGEWVRSTTASGYGFLNDTSAAAAIIAGAALSIQGIAQMQGRGDLPNGRFSPARLQSILRDPSIGTVSSASNWDSSYNPTWDPTNNDFSKWNADKIGVMPDLRSIIQQFTELIPLTSNSLYTQD